MMAVFMHARASKAPHHRMRVKKEQLEGLVTLVSYIVLSVEVD